MNSASFGQSSQYVTSVNLQMLQKQRLAYEAYEKVLDATGDDLIKKVEILLRAARARIGSGALTLPPLWAAS
jgi:hypothetical protein